MLILLKCSIPKYKVECYKDSTQQNKMKNDGNFTYKPSKSPYKTRYFLNKK